MAENSKIEWTTHTWNPWRGCTKVSDGCKNCYAETLSKRNPGVLGSWGPKGHRVVAKQAYWDKPRQWNKQAKADGVRYKVFCASLADVFEGPETMRKVDVPVIEKAREELFHVIGCTPYLDWLILTKRPENVTKMWEGWLKYDPGTPLYENMWIGTSVENQATANERIPHLLKIKTARRFLSCEPLLGPVQLDSIPSGNPKYPIVDSLIGMERKESDKVPGYCSFNEDDYYDQKYKDNPEEPYGLEFVRDPGISWVIVGGESGPNKRPFDPDWARSLRDQCKEANVPFFGKQWDKVKPLPEDLMIREFPESVVPRGLVIPT